MRLLLVEDEEDLAIALSDGLRHDGYHVDVVHNGAEALVQVASKDLDLIVLDRDLPVLSGDAVCRTLRSQGHPIPILMLTAAGSLEDRITGLDLGADDYLAKPFAYLELLARLRALSRRARGASVSVLECAGIRLDLVRRRVERDGRPIDLSPKEYGVLEALLLADGGFLAVEELLDEVWQEASERGRSVVKATVHTLRVKLGDPNPIKSAPGHGYRMGEEQ